MEEAGFIKDLALLIIGAVVGMVPWLLDKVGIEMPKPVYIVLLLLSVALVGWALNSLGWIERIPLFREKRIPLSTGIICGAVLFFSVWLLLGKIGADIKYDYRKWQSDRNEVISRKAYLNEAVELDGKTFDHCTFTNATLVYHGLASTNLIEPTFHGSLALRTDNQAAKGLWVLTNFVRSVPGVSSYTFGEIDDKGGIREIESSAKKVEVRKTLPLPAEVISGRNYLNETVDIDGRVFDHCTFTNVTFFYHGTGYADFKEVKFFGDILLKTDDRPAMAYMQLATDLKKYPGIKVGHVYGIDTKGGMTPIDTEPPAKVPK